MATAAITSQGIKFEKSSGGQTPTYTAIGEITSINGPSESAKQIDVTSLDSTSREYIPGLRDGGEVSFDFNFVPGDTGQEALRTALAAGTSGEYRITLTDAGSMTIEFAAIVTAFSVKAGVDSQVSGSASLKITGDVTYTA